MHAYRPYQILRKMDTAPQLPYDYLYSMLLAFWPKGWMSTIEPILFDCHTKQGQGGNSQAVQARTKRESK